MRKYTYFILTTLILASFFIIGCEQTPVNKAIIKDTTNQFVLFCGKEDVSQVYVCGDDAVVVHKSSKDGISVYRSDGIVIPCPLMKINLMESTCQDYLFRRECERLFCI
jgi:hypothetical protein